MQRKLVLWFKYVSTYLTRFHNWRVSVNREKKKEKRKKKCSQPLAKELSENFQRICARKLS